VCSHVKVIELCEDTYLPSSGELYDFDMRRHLVSIIWGAL
jgi:hypothetical protein